MTTQAATAAGLFDLSGRVALVTGASRGIGRAVALTLGGLGASVAVNHLADAEGGDAVVDELRHHGRRALAIDLDIGLAGAPEALLALVQQQLGPVDTLVVNAAITRYAPLEDLTDDDMDAQLAVNLRATVALLRAVLPGMTERGFGRIVTIGSINQLTPSPILPLYAALKAAQLNLVLGIARRYASRGITVNNVAPGLIRTERNAWRREPGGGWEEVSRAASYVGRAGEPEEVALAVAMFCSRHAGFMTGSDLYVAGGAQIPGPRVVGDGVVSE